ATARAGLADVERVCSAWVRVAPDLRIGAAADRRWAPGPQRRRGRGSTVEHRIAPSATPSGPGPSGASADEPPRKPVRARTPLTPQALVDRADVTPRTPEAETVLRIFRRRQQEHAALYVAEMRDL